MIVLGWTGIEIKALRTAMQLSIEEFARAAAVSTRSVDAWESAGAAASLRPSSKRQLDHVLGSASSTVAARFAALLGASAVDCGDATHTSPTPAKLANDVLGQAAVLGADEADLVWVPARTAAGEVLLVSLPRRAVVAGVGVSALAMATGAKPAAVLANSPDTDRLEHFRNLRLSLIESDNLHGARDVIPLVEQSIERIGQLHTAGYGDPAGTQRVRVLYSEFAAWLHQDCRNFLRAQYWTDRGLTWSHQLGDPFSVAVVLSRKAQIANDMGDGLEARELAEAAARAAPPETRFSAVAHTFAGHGSALVGDRARSEAAFDRARELTEQPDTGSSWGSFLDQAYIDAHQAHSRTELGDHHGAIDQFGRAIAHMQSGQTRDHGVYLARRALACARAGEAEAAAQLATAVLEVGVSTGSERILHCLRTVHAMLDPHSTETEIVEFCAAAQKWSLT
ncbi:helix-turn-helix domain-containing protein [Nocardia vermiculata]|uniref:HTH cro/C1-type domain-containing protein n=1 Tax=Nocardia vermiculata TaxID=257274 RepID=A0A846XY68_9NOCA|nr:hypothetical protein [Nocardia vermiculata]NKY52043.1 hypothetical protein [Nocardia vermiculata]